MQPKSSIPLCMQLQTVRGKTNGAVSISDETFQTKLSGLCLYCDSGSYTQTRNSTSAYLLRFSRSPYGTNQTITVLLKLQLIEESLFDLYTLNQQVSLDEAEQDFPPWSNGLKCHRRAPTFAVLIIRTDVCIQPWSAQMHLWTDIVRRILQFPENPGDFVQSGKVDVNISTVFVEHGFQFFNRPDRITEHLQILASATANNSAQVESLFPNTFAAVWQIGCGSISPAVLEPLALLEKQFLDQPVSLGGFETELETNQTSRAALITQWIVGDLINANYLTSERSAFRSLSTQNHKAGRLVRSLDDHSSPVGYPTHQFGNAFDEGSGIYPNYRYSGFGGVENLHPLYTPSRTNFVLQPIAPVKITVHQITNVQIPPKTFSGYESISDLELILYLIANDVNLTADQIRSPETNMSIYGQPVTRDANEWISFDKKNRIVRLRPLPQHVGNHQLVLCAVSRSYPKSCEPFLVTVRRPPPFRKNFILRIPPGVFWCYRVPVYWFEELKVNAFEDLELTVNGDTPFSWDMQTSEVCVVTMLKVEQIITLFFYASNKQIAQSVEVEFRLSAKAPPTQRLVTQSRVRLTLQCPDQMKTYQLQELNRINASLAQVLRVRVNPEVTASAIFIYDITQFFASTNETSPATLEIDWVFLPFGVPAEGDKNLLSSLGNLDSIEKITRIGTLSGHQTSYLDRSALSLTLPDLLKRCQVSRLDGAEVALKATEESFRPFKIHSVKLHDLENSACYLTKRLTEKSHSKTNGISEDNRPGWFEAANLKMMPEVVNNFTVTADGLKLDDSAWVGLTSDSSHLFGLPLKQHLRKQPYVFGLHIYSVDQKTPISVGFTIEVQDWFGAGTTGQSDPIMSNHRVRLRILPSTSSKNTVVSKTNWAIEPINSLDYRWHLSTAIDRFLRPNCPPPCNPDVGIWELNRHGEGFRYKITRAENLKSKETRQLHLFDIMGQKIGSSSWIGLEEDRSTIYGIVMGNAVQPITYRFRIAVSAEAEDGAHFSVYVTGSDPKLPSTYNHHVIMRFGADIGDQWANGHSLRDRWRLVAALDTFLRPHCITDNLCRNSMDVLLLTFNYQVSEDFPFTFDWIHLFGILLLAHGFTVIWAQKSLLMKTSDRDIQWQQLDTFEQRQQQQQHKKHWDRWMQEKNTWSIQRTDRRQARLKRAPLDSCPERDLIHLERRLLGDTGFGLLPLPELAQHLKASGVGLLKEVQVERLGPCAKTLTNLPFEVPEPSGVHQRGIPVPDPFKPSQNDVGMTSYSPTEKHDRQRTLLLGILLPVCISLILLLVVILGFVWLRKRRKQKTNNQRNIDLKLATGHSASNPEAELRIKMKNKQLKSVNTFGDERDNGLPNKDIPLVCKRQKSLVTPVNDGLEDSCSPPTKPLILPNERPPLKPPEYNMAYTESPVNTLPQFPISVTPIAPAFPAMTSNPGGQEGPGQGAPPKAFYGMRPNPYRNLPPPIEVKPGMPSPASQLPYAPYRKTTTLTQIQSIDR
ncbi:hypothetical protein PHET_01210 [Paragonimus heterotremus]|uniref:Dystroglycan n=1 Tax=Paragonimus heterotremus TaxID=100268 RepID=A0A8J4TRU9_9TREM|nr:hypothetical protein PHET_01210 [Paragonimus heterotremus]